MKLFKQKKAAFDVINAGMLSFISFVLIVLLVILLVTVVRETTIVCPETSDDGICLSCSTNYFYNSSGNVCCNATGCPTDYLWNASATLCCNSTATAPFDCATGNTTATIQVCASGQTTAYDEYTGSAYNGTKDLQEAAALPPQFAQIIVIVIVIVGILTMLAAIGYMAYQKIKK